MKLSENIYTLRRERSLSQENLAEQLKVTRQTISNWELGQTAPNPEQLMKLSGIFEISIDELVGNDFIPKKKEEKPIYRGLIITGMILFGLWAYSQNRFDYDELLFIILSG